MRCHKNTCPTGVTTHDPELQRGLVPAVKADRAASYAQHLIHEVEIIAHSCGVPEPRGLRRHHVRIVGPDGRSTPMNALHPEPMDSRPERL
jgi:glutamate synthase domain-containing protein 2